MRVGSGLGRRNLGLHRGHWTEPVGADSVAHEVGHNFGLDHANSLECAGAGSFRDGTQVHKPTWPCTTQEYGDYSAIMGMDVDDVSSGIPPTDDCPSRSCRPSDS